MRLPSGDAVGAWRGRRAEIARKRRASRPIGERIRRPGIRHRVRDPGIRPGYGVPGSGTGYGSPGPGPGVGKPGSGATGIPAGIGLGIFRPHSVVRGGRGHRN